MGWCKSLLVLAARELRGCGFFWGGSFGSQGSRFCKSRLKTSCFDAGGPCAP